MNDKDFLSLISNYDIICRSECWITENDDFDIAKYCKLVFPRKKGKGDRIVIFYKETLHAYLSLIENIHDCIIWVKLEQVSHDYIFVAFCYFPSEYSTCIFYNNSNMIDIDLFQCLETKRRRSDPVL